MKKPRLLAIVGPTGSGKGSLALSLADEFPVVLISVDSRKIYRGMDIGTNKPPKEKRKLFRLIDIIEPQETYSAGQFAMDAEKEAESAMSQGKIPVLVGGTILYYIALFRGLSPVPRPSRELRERVLRMLRELGPWGLWERLREVDPARASQVHPNDWVRVSRALEIYYATGKPPSEVYAQRRPPKFSPAYVAPEYEPNRLKERIEARVDRMMEMGLLDEVRALLDRYGPGAPGLRTIGYRELVEHLVGRLTLGEAVRLIKRDTWDLARRQIRFMRSLGPIRGPDWAWKFLDSVKSKND